MGGTAYVALDGQRETVFDTLVLGDDRDACAAVGELGLHEVTLRPMRQQRRFWPAEVQSPGVTAVFPMRRRPDLTHEQADAHWRDTHAPLALRHHPGMWHYHQVSIDGTLQGEPFDGIALCAFASEQDMSERFFGDDEDRRIIGADVATFADMAASPRRIKMVEWRFGAG